MMLEELSVLTGRVKGMGTVLGFGRAKHNPERLMVLLTDVLLSDGEHIVEIEKTWISVSKHMKKINLKQKRFIEFQCIIGARRKKPEKEEIISYHIGKIRVKNVKKLTYMEPYILTTDEKEFVVLGKDELQVVESFEKITGRSVNHVEKCDENVERELA